MISCRIRRQVEQPCPQNTISAGDLAIVHKLNDRVIRKVPSKKLEIYSARAIEIEGHVYGHLGKHRRIARYISYSDGFADLRYERNGDLESYLKKTDPDSYARYGFARQAVEAVAYIHEMEVIHSDLSARQFLVDKNRNLRLSDFCGSSLQGSEAIVMENTTHFLPRDENLPNTIQSDLFALGCTIYEILLGRRPYEGMDDEDIQRLYSEKCFPGLDGIEEEYWRDVIEKCWLCEYERATDILGDIPYISCIEYGRLEIARVGRLISGLWKRMQGRRPHRQASLWGHQEV